MSHQLWWQMVVMVVVAARAGGLDRNDETESTDGMKTLDNFIKNNVKALCAYVRCQEPLDADECPQDSVYVEGAAQFGCCSACVTFKQIGEKCVSRDVASLTQDKSRDDATALHQEQAKDLPPNTNILSSSQCAFHLYCNASGMCELAGDDTRCRYIQAQYDAAVNDSSLYVHYRDDYRWRPDCTPEGYFAPTQLKGPVGERRAVCVDPAGKTIYGKAYDWQWNLWSTMNCKCSRQAWEWQQAGRSSITHHCLENGNYEPLQCQDGWCYCVDPDSTKPYGFLLPEEAVHFLPCYNSTLMGEQYLRRCESASYAHWLLMDAMLAKGVQGPQNPYNCDQDGSYSGEKCQTGWCRCIDKYDSSDSLTLDSTGGCNCARDRWFFQSTGNIHHWFDCRTPDGSEGGMYNTIQHYSSNYAVYCSDQDGVRAGPLVFDKYEELLDCEAAINCQNGDNDACQDACQNCNTTVFVKYDNDFPLYDTNSV